MARRDRTVLVVVGSPDRHQRRLIKWARRADPRVQISQLTSIGEAPAVLRVLDHPKDTSVVVYVRWFSAGSDAEESYEITEERVAACKRKLIIRERPFSASAADYFRSPPGTEYTFLLPACPSLSPRWYFQGAISAYPYLLIGKFLEDQEEHGWDAIDRLRAEPEDWQRWVLQVLPLKRRPNVHPPFPDCIFAVWNLILRVCRRVRPARAS